MFFLKKLAKHHILEEILLISRTITTFMLSKSMHLISYILGLGVLYSPAKCTIFIVLGKRSEKTHLWKEPYLTTHSWILPRFAYLHIYKLVCSSDSGSKCNKELSCDCSAQLDRCSTSPHPSHFNDGWSSKLATTDMRSWGRQFWWDFWLWL